MEEGLTKILLDQDDRANKFFPITCVFARTYDRWSTLQMTKYDPVECTLTDSTQPANKLQSKENFVFQILWLGTNLNFNRSIVLDITYLGNFWV